MILVNILCAPTTVILINTVSGNYFFLTVLFFSFQGGRKVEYPTDPKVTSVERKRECECWEVRE